MATIRQRERNIELAAIGIIVFVLLVQSIMAACYMTAYDASQSSAQERIADAAERFLRLEYGQ